MPGSRYVIAVDQGTTNTKAVILDRQGQVLYRASRPVKISFPRAGWVEQDANDIWSTAQAVLGECFDTCEREEVAAIDHRRGQRAMVDHRSRAWPPS